MKVGDLVRIRENRKYRVTSPYAVPEYPTDQVGLIVKILPAYPWADEEDGRMMEVLFPHPIWTAPNGASIMFEAELEIVDESRRSS